MLKVGSDFSGVGAFDQALIRLGIDYMTVFACDMDKYSRKTYVANYGEPAYFPENVYDRIIPDESLDIYMTSPPCQAFSLAGKRLGKEDERGILFFNSHEFIMKNRPRFFIFENVKGLLSDDGGRTFQEWINYLGGKSVNGVHTLFPTDESAPYHIYYRVLNAKKHGVPQNRERIFIIGIRDDEDNVFSWPKEQPLTKRLRDVLESEVDEKYFLSEKMVNCLLRNQEKTGFKMDLKNGDDMAHCITTSEAKMGTRCNYIKSIGNTNPSGHGMNGNVFDEDGISPTLSTNKGEGIKIKSATKSGFEVATENDSINYSVPNSETRRGRVGVGVAQTLDTSCNQAVICVPVLTPDRAEKRQNGRRFKDDGEEMFTITTQDRHGVYNGCSIRRLTPTECFRLMDFPDSLVENARAVGMSDSQLYKQAGNSIVVACLVGIINGMKKLVK